MGRYESQRAIAARTISERRHARKGGRMRHGGWLAWFLGRLAAFSLTVVTVIAAASLWPRASLPPPTSPVIATVTAKLGKAPFTSKWTELAGARPSMPIRRAPAPADAHHARTAPADPDYQVLSPDELAAISQAH